MKKKIAILGSTGSIGKSLIDIIKSDKRNYQITLLTANRNYKELFKQAKYFNVKNLIVTDYKSYNLANKKNIPKKFNIYNNYKCFKKIFKNKNDFIMSSITGLDGLEPTLNSIKFTKNILIANKEAIICGWNLIEREILRYKTNFIPVDSEHFSIWYALKGINKNLIEKIYLTASGGPFLKVPLKKLKNVKVNEAINHPNWKMGKKISIDSATMMNKVFEIIEAKKIFDISYKKISILIHPKSYIHAILKFKNGITKIVVHDTNMRIPIFNSLYSSENTIKSNEINFDILNKLDLQKIDSKRFPIIKVINKLPERSSLFETILVLINDKLVDLFLNNKIKFTDISKKMNIILRLKEFKKFKMLKLKKINDVMNLNAVINKKINKLIKND